MRTTCRHQLLELAAALSLLIALSSPAEAGFRDWLKRVLGRRYEYVSRLVTTSAPAPVSGSPEERQPEPDMLMLLDLRTLTTSPLPGAPRDCRSPVAAGPATIAVLGSAGRPGGNQEQGLWVYSRRTKRAREVIPAEALPAGVSFFAIAGPDPDTAGSVIVVLRAAQPAVHTLVVLADLHSGKMSWIPDVPPIADDPSATPDVRDLLYGSRIQEGRLVQAVPSSYEGGASPRRNIGILPLSPEPAVVRGLSLEVDPGGGKDCADPSWLSGSEIIYVAKQWPPL